MKIYIFGKVEMPGWLSRAPRSVPASILAALVLPALTYPAVMLDLSRGNIRLVACKTRSILWTIAVGTILF